MTAVGQPSTGEPIPFISSLPDFPSKNLIAAGGKIATSRKPVQIWRYHHLRPPPMHTSQWQPPIILHQQISVLSSSSIYQFLRCHLSFHPLRRDLSSLTVVSPAPPITTSPSLDTATSQPSVAIPTEQGLRYCRLAPPVGHPPPSLCLWPARLFSSMRFSAIDVPIWFPKPKLHIFFLRLRFCDILMQVVYLCV